MICPENGNKSFDDLECRDCKWFMQCFKMYQHGNIFGKDDPMGDNFPEMNNGLPSFIKNGKCEKDNMTSCNLGYACDACPYNKEKKSPTDTERIMINALAQEIKDYGEERVWQNINTIAIERRLEYIELFLSAKRLLEIGEY